VSNHIKHGSENTHRENNSQQIQLKVEGRRTNHNRDQFDVQFEQPKLFVSFCLNPLFPIMANSDDDGMVLVHGDVDDDDDDDDEVVEVEDPARPRNRASFVKTAHVMEDAVYGVLESAVSPTGVEIPGSNKTLTLVTKPELQDGLRECLTVDSATKHFYLKSDIDEQQNNASKAIEQCVKKDAFGEALKHRPTKEENDEKYVKVDELGDKVNQLEERREMRDAINGKVDRKHFDQTIKAYATNKTVTTKLNQYLTRKQFNEDVPGFATVQFVEESVEEGAQSLRARIDGNVEAVNALTTTIDGKADRAAIETLTSQNANIRDQLQTVTTQLGELRGQFQAHQRHHPTSGLATDDFAKKTDLDKVVDDLKETNRSVAQLETNVAGKADKSELEGKADKSDLEGKVGKAELEDFAANKRPADDDGLFVSSPVAQRPRISGPATASLPAGVTPTQQSPPEPSRLFSGNEAVKVTEAPSISQDNNM